MDDQPRLPLLGGETIGLRSAENCPDNILVELEYPRLDKIFRQEIMGKQSDIESMVCRLLGVRAAYMWGEGQWQSGSFNLAIPIEVGHSKRVFLRLPLPYRNANPRSAEDSDEKLRTEIATYLWMEDHCPDVPIPTLHAFGLPDGQCYTHPRNTPLFTKLTWNLRRWLRGLLGREVPTRHIKRNYHNPLSPGYLLLSEAKGKNLAKCWEDHWHDETYRQNLCRSIAGISLSMNKIPLPRIGSWHFNPDGTITLSNRPLHLHITVLESQGVPSGIPRDRTYTAVESYLSDILAFHDNIIMHQPNAVSDEEDGRMQLATLTGLRSVMHHFITPGLKNGPFHLSLTDLRPTNIFVDEAGNITTIIDLEFTCARPVSMQLPPYWLTATSLDALAEAGTDEHHAFLQEYMDIYEAEEKKRNGDTGFAKMQRQAWDSGAFWFNHAVMAPNRTPQIFRHRIHPRFQSRVEGSVFNDAFSRCWSVDSADVMQRKLEERDRYMFRVRQAFGHMDEE